MQAVVDEDVHRAHFTAQLRQPSPTRSLNIGPARERGGSDRSAGLGVQRVIERVREVDTPQPPTAVPVQRLKYDLARDIPRDTGFDHYSRAHMAHRAPCRPPE